jgi:hypothetical protein
MKSVLAIAIVLWFASYVLAREDEETRIETVAKLKSFTDEQLRQSLKKLLESSDFRNDSLYEPCLNEIVRRGGKTWEAILNTWLETLNKKLTKRTEVADDTEPGSHYNLELLTALRRVQKKSDPVVVLWDAQEPLEATSLSLPRLKVKIKNLDSEKTTVGFRNGGDYRSGRQARWRIVARDGNGTQLPVRGPLSSQHGLTFGGGQYQEDVLKYGESWDTVVDVGSFVKIRQPGTYSLEVLYHNTKAIADESDISGLIVSRSKLITLIVRPLVIELTMQERKQAVQGIAALNANQRLKVVAGTYGEWAHKFVPPNSPEGRVLSMGIKAVPALVESLGNKSLSDRKRAWILTLLFSATGDNDPRESSVLGEYEYREMGWQVLGSKSGEGASGGLAMPDEGSSSGGKIDREAQDRLIGVWEDWLKKVEVRQGTRDDHPKPAATSNTR